MPRSTSYHNACAHLTLGAEKLEEMITMTENTNKKRLSRPLKTALIAAACVAALVVTAFAAPAIHNFFTATSLVITDEGGQTAQLLAAPEMTLKTEDGKSLLTIGGQTVDVTDAFATDGFYETTYEDARVHVTKEGIATVTITAEGQEGASYTYDLSEESTDVGILTRSQVVSDENGNTTVVEQEVKAEGAAQTFTFTEGEEGEMLCTDENGDPVELPEN